MSTFKHTKLFGGAITANIPPGFADVSTIRQIPDNQEVYLSTTGLTSLIFDLAERVVPSSTSTSTSTSTTTTTNADTDTDIEALKFHLSDIVNEGDASNIISIQQIHLPNFPAGTPALTLHAATTAAAPPSSRSPEPQTTTILLTLIRLAPQKTDVVITVNIPHVAGEDLDFIDQDGGSGGDPGETHGTDEGQETQFKQLVKQGRKIRDEAVSSTRVRDWGLFG